MPESDARSVRWTKMSLKNTDQKSAVDVFFVVVVFYDIVAADFRLFISQTCFKEASRPTFQQLDSYCRDCSAVVSVTHACGDDDDEVMLNVLRCHLTH